jgi:hypothetical protein
MNDNDLDSLKGSVEWLLERYDIDDLPVKVMIEAIERLAGVKVELEAEKDYVWRNGEEVEVVKWVWSVAKEISV